MNETLRFEKILIINDVHYCGFSDTETDVLDKTLTWGRLKEGFLLLLDGLSVIVGRPFVHGQRGDLLVRLPTVVTVVWFGVSVNNMMFVQTGILCKPFITPRDCTNIWLFP